MKAPHDDIIIISNSNDEAEDVDDEIMDCGWVTVHGWNMIRGWGGEGSYANG